MSENGRDKGETWAVSAFANSKTPRLKRELVIEALKRKKGADIEEKSEEEETIKEESDSDDDDDDEDSDRTVKELGEFRFSACTTLSWR